MALTPFLRAPPSLSNYLPKTPPPNTITLGIRVSTYEIGETIKSIAVPEEKSDTILIFASLS